MALDLSRPVTPPPPVKKTATAKTTAKASAAKTSEREEAVNGLFQLGAAGLMMAGPNFRADAVTVAKHGSNVAHEVAEIAESNAQFAKVIDYISAVGPYAGLLTAVMPMVLQILANHNRVPAASLSAFGVEDPKTMVAKMEADAQNQYLREQAEIAAQRAENEDMTQRLRSVQND